MSPDPEGNAASPPRPVGRFEWEQTVLRIRWTGIVKAGSTRGAVSGAVFRAVAWAIICHASADGGDIWPGDDKVAILAEVGGKNVAAVKRKLVELGLLTRVRAGARREHGGDVYQLTLPEELPEEIHELSRDEINASLERVRKERRGRRRPASASDFEPCVSGPLDPTREPSMSGPLDPTRAAVQGPVDLTRDGRVGSTGPPETCRVGSSGPYVLGPVDPRTKHYQLTRPTNQALVEDHKQEPAEPADETSAAVDPPPARPKFVAPVPPRWRMEPERLIAAALADDDPTDDEVRAVNSWFVATAKPKGVPLYRHVAAEGGIPWRTHLVELRTAASAAAKDEVDELRKRPPCVHGAPGGDQLGPTTGKPLCPQCRRGVPAPVDEPDPVDTYRRLYKRQHGEPTRQLMQTVAHQIAEFGRRGADRRTLLAAVGAAAIAGHDLISHLRPGTETASA